MAKKNNNSNFRDIKYIKLAYEQASINLGSTSTNPSVGCVVVKNNSVISSGYTSLNGRPHAEKNALEKNENYKNSDLYVTLEPCSHYGKTPACINNIIHKKIRRVIFSTYDIDERSKKKSEKKLKNKKIVVKKFILAKLAKKFYQSYFLQTTTQLPFIDAKLAISNDLFTINKKNKWITNIKSRRLGNFLRSKYDCLLTTSKTINVDDPLLDCRIEGLEKKTPVLCIVDRSFIINKNSKIFKEKNRKIYIFVITKNEAKEKYLKDRGIRIIRFSQNYKADQHLIKMFYFIKKLGFHRILIESGITFLNQMLRFKMIKNFYLFKTPINLKSKGSNNSNILLIKKLKISKKNKIGVNLKEDSLYKVQL